MRYIGVFLCTVCILLAQTPSVKEETDVKLPNGKSQKDEIIRVDYERNLKDAGDLARLAEEIKDDLEKGDRYLVSTKTLKKLDDVEKLTKDIRQRLRRN
jgi:biopolymer transport protein ExbD